MRQSLYILLMNHCQKLRSSSSIFMTLKNKIQVGQPLNIAQAYQGFVEEPVPSTLFDVIESGAPKKLISIALLLLAFIAGASLVLVSSSFRNEKAEIDLYNLPAATLAVSAHKTLSTDAVHPVQVYADDMSHLNYWLSYRVGKETSIKMLSSSGFTLIGANQIPDSIGASSLLVYENSDKERLSLFTRYHGGSNALSEPVHVVSDSLNALHWQQDGEHRVLVGSLDNEVLKRIFQKLQ